jgi:hypothetical protein
MAYASLNEVKIYRGMTSANTADDDLLTDLISAAQSQVESYCGRVFEAAAIASTRYYDALEDVSDDGLTLYLGTDCVSITAVTNGDDTSLTASDYVTEPRNSTPYHAIKLKLGGSYAWTYEDSPENAIEVKGKWAYSETAPAAVRQATIRLAAYMYAQKDASTFDVTALPDAGVIQIPQGMPADVKQILEPYRRLR